MEKEIKEYISKNDQLARHLGMKLTEVSSGYAKAQVTVAEKHLNSVRGTHGGTIFTLADFAFAAACNSHGTVSLALNMNVTYIKATTVGDTLHAECTEDALKRRIAFYTIRVTDDSGDLVATLQATAYRKKDPMPPV